MSKKLKLYKEVLTKIRKGDSDLTNGVMSAIYQYFRGKDKDVAEFINQQMLVQTSVHIAIKVKNHSLISQLLMCGGRWDIKDSRGKIAAEYDTLGIVKQFEEFTKQVMRNPPPPGGPYPKFVFDKNPKKRKRKRKKKSKRDVDVVSTPVAAAGGGGNVMVSVSAEQLEREILGNLLDEDDEDEVLYEQRTPERSDSHNNEQQRSTTPPPIVDNQQFHRHMLGAFSSPHGPGPVGPVGPGRVPGPGPMMSHNSPQRFVRVISSPPLLHQRRRMEEDMKRALVEKDRMISKLLEKVQHLKNNNEVLEMQVRRRRIVSEQKRVKDVAKVTEELREAKDRVAELEMRAREFVLCRQAKREGEAREKVLTAKLQRAEVFIEKLVEERKEMDEELGVIREELGKEHEIKTVFQIKGNYEAQFEACMAILGEFEEAALDVKNVQPCDIVEEIERLDGLYVDAKNDLFRLKDFFLRAQEVAMEKVNGFFEEISDLVTSETSILLDELQKNISTTLKGSLGIKKETLEALHLVKVENYFTLAEGLYFRAIRCLNNSSTCHRIIKENLGLAEEKNSIKEKLLELNETEEENNVFAEIEMKGEIDELREIEKVNKRVIREIEKSREYVNSLQRDLRYENLSTDPFLSKLDSLNVYEYDYSFDDHYSSKVLLQHKKYWKLFTATCLASGSIIVLKVLDNDTNSRAIVENEVEKLQKLNHPNIAKIQRCFIFESDDDIKKVGKVNSPEEETSFLERRQKKQLRICIDFGEIGESFNSWLKKNKNEKTSILKLFGSLLRALLFVHSHGFIIRNINPSSVFVNARNVPKFINFARAVHHTYPGNHIASTLKSESSKYSMGSASEPCQKNDVWSLGRLMLDSICPKARKLNPMDDEFESHLNMIQSLTEYEKEVIVGMLKVDRVERWSCEQVLAHPLFGQVLCDSQLAVLEIPSSLVDDKKRVSIELEPTVESIEENFLVKCFGNSTDFVQIDCVYPSLKLVDLQSRQTLAFLAEILRNDHPAFDYITAVNGDPFILPTDAVSRSTFFFSLGKVLCKCLWENIQLYLPFGPLVFRVLLSQIDDTLSTWKELATYYNDSEIQNILDLCESNVVPEKYRKYFSFVGNDNVLHVLTKQNCDEFAVCKIREKLFGRGFRKHNLEELKRGFFSLMSEDQMEWVKMLSWKNLRDLINGAQLVTSDEIASNFECDWDSKNLNRLYLKKWIHFSGIDGVEKQFRFLRFVTGSDTIPVTKKLTKTKLAGDVGEVVLFFTKELPSSLWQKIEVTEFSSGEFSIESDRNECKLCIYGSTNDYEEFVKVLDNALCNIPLCLESEWK